ncbi:hypothetical protein [Paradesulfitobacterium ferrireducens]|uniref:hypothetical protein n=1 Tax=Paradesulfitobacterium ferrireducens TaxID=2816476 RepID=UPI001A8E82E7|nr:hypothetical protein [Paradesulfitobacterium ferrireducens]
MIEAMIQGQENPETLSEMAKGKLKSKKADLQRAMHGLMGIHQKIMLDTQPIHPIGAESSRQSELHRLV